MFSSGAVASSSLCGCPSVGTERGDCRLCGHAAAFWAMALRSLLALALCFNIWVAKMRSDNVLLNLNSLSRV